MGFSVLDIIVAVATLILLAIITTVLQQLLFKNHDEPPVVFHWLPVIGSTVIYGIDPFKFFFDCQKKVGNSPPHLTFCRLYRKEC